MADKTFRIRATAADGAPNEGVDIKLVDIGGSTYAIAAQGGTGASSTTVQGTAADGAAVAGNPVRIGGKDGAGNTQDVATDTSGNLGVGTGTAGTAAANVVTVQGIASATPVRVKSYYDGAITITSVTTADTGANWTAFSASACVGLDLVNNTGTALEYRRGAAGTGFQLPDGASRFIEGITNASQIDVRRVDQSNTQVTAYAELFAA